MSAVPTDIRQASADLLAITWQDGSETTYAVRDLRLLCPCAECVDEITQQRRLDPSAVPTDVRPIRIRSVGNYAVSIAWSDGHDSGIYSFEFLKELGNPT